jgi:hypothetical protein
MTSTYTSRMLAGSSISQLSLHFDRYDTHLTVSRPFFAVVQAATALALSVSETILGKMLEATSTSGGSSGSANNSSSASATADASRYGHHGGSNSTANSVNGGNSIASNGDDVRS